MNIFYDILNPIIGVANGTAKNIGLGKFCQDLEISEAFMISLEVLFFHGLFLLFWVSKLFTKESRARISNWDLGVMASLGFYHSPPLIMTSFLQLHYNQWINIMVFCFCWNLVRVFFMFFILLSWMCDINHKVSKPVIPLNNTSILNI